MNALHPLQQTKRTIFYFFIFIFVFSPFSLIAISPSKYGGNAENLDTDGRGMCMEKQSNRSCYHAPPAK